MQETITFDFPDENARDAAINALAASFGWQSTVKDENGADVPNPVGQTAHVKTQIGVLLFGRIKQQLITNAFEATEQQCAAVLGATVVT